MNASADWPEPLRVNAASIRLARELHAARCEAFCVNWPTFDDLAVSVRRAYIDTANAILKATIPVSGLPHDVEGLIPQLARTRMRVAK